MKKKNLIILIAILIIVVAAGILVFNPPKRVKGGLRGEIVPNSPTYREEYQCFGIERDFCPSWPDYGCDHLCYGFIYGEKCFLETYTAKGLEKQLSECR